MRETLFTLLMTACLGFHAPLCTVACSSEAGVPVARQTDPPPCHGSEPGAPPAEDCASCEDARLVAVAQPALQAPALVPLAAFSLASPTLPASRALGRQAPPPPSDGPSSHDILLQKSTLLL